MEQVVLVAINAKFCHTSLAVRSLGAYLRQNGIETVRCEFTINESADDLLEALVETGGTTFCFSCYLWNMALVQRLGRELKQLLPRARIVLGGPEVSFDPEAEDYSFADTIVCGEGEEALLSYLRGTDCPRVVQARPVSSLDMLPPAYDDLEEVRDRIVYYESSRGCPFSCAYCLSSATKGVRYLSLERVYEDLLRFGEKKVSLVKFVDRTFNADGKRAVAIWRFLLEHCPDTRFHFEIAAEWLDEEQLAVLAQFPPGRVQLEIGVQSTCGETLQAVHRKSDTERLFDRVRRVMKPGNIPVHLDLIAGLPYEGYERFGQSFDEVYALSPDCLQLGFLKMLKGSAIRRDAEQYGYCYSPYPPYQVRYNQFLSYGEICRLERIANLLEKYYNSGVFVHTLAFAVQQFPSAFAMWEELEAFYKDRCGRLPVAQKKLYALFGEFYIESGRPHGDRVLEYLRLDQYRNGIRAPKHPDEGAELQKLLFSLLEQPGFLETYLPQMQQMRRTEIVKQVCLGRFSLPEEVYYLFTHTKTICLGGEPWNSQK